MRLSPPFVSSEDLYHLGELFLEDGGARGTRTHKGVTPTSFQDWLHNQFEHRSKRLAEAPRFERGRGF